jgi:hypothetical protein
MKEAELNISKRTDFDLSKKKVKVKKKKIRVKKEKREI